MNDNEVLVQRVNGAIGGLTLVLDTLTGDYLPETVSSRELRFCRSCGKIILPVES